MTRRSNLRFVNADPYPEVGYGELVLFTSRLNGGCIYAAEKVGAMLEALGYRYPVRVLPVHPNVADGTLVAKTVRLDANGGYETLTIAASPAEVASVFGALDRFVFGFRSIFADEVEELELCNRREFSHDDLWEEEFDDEPLPCKCSAECSFGPVEEEVDEDVESDTSWMREMETLVARKMAEYMARYHRPLPIDRLQDMLKGLVAMETVAKLSPLVVDGDFRLMLPELNGVEIRMTPLAKTVYLLFLVHPEGIRLNEIDSYRSELEQIYAMVKPGASERVAQSTIAELVNPMGTSVHQNITRTRQAVRRHVYVARLVEEYTVGNCGDGLFRISLPAELRRLPRALRGLGDSHKF